MKKNRSDQANIDLALKIVDSYLTEVKFRAEEVRNFEYAWPTIIFSMIALLPALYVILSTYSGELSFDFILGRDCRFSVHSWLLSLHSK